MPKENAFIGGIKSIIPASEIAAKKRLPEQTQLVAVNLEEEQVAYLDL